MLFEISVAAAQAASAPLKLELLCPGQYRQVETIPPADPTGGQASRFETRWVSGSARLSLNGQTGEIAYPDGAKRALTSVAANTDTITASYQRRSIVLRVSGKITLSRLTGDLEVIDGSSTDFRGNCTALPTQPKF